MDQINLKGLRIMGKHGVMASEKALGQPFIIDATLYLDLSLAGQTDDLLATIHYGQVYELIEALVGGTCYDLIETLCYRLVGQVLAFDDRIQEVEITVKKPHAPIYGHFDHASITIRRKREDLDLSEFR